MFNRQSWIIGGLLALTIFIICNCAGYLLFSVIGSGNNLVADSASIAPAQEEVVAYVTPTIATESTNSNAPLPTPIALLPTITPGAPATPSTSNRQSGSETLPDLPSVAPVNEEIAPLQILSHKSYVDSLGWYHIVGEVQNNSNAPMEFVEVIAKLYDEANVVIGTKLTFTAPDVIFPGGRAPFDIIALRRSQWDKIKQYQLQVKGDVSEKLLRQNLVLLDQASRIENGVLFVSGQVQNTGAEPSLVKLIITLYDADHNVINTNWGYADAGLILPNQTSSFEVKIQHQTDPNNYHYSIQIEEERVDTD